jgi:hypothetical protein
VCLKCREKVLGKAAFDSINNWGVKYREAKANRRFVKDKVGVFHIESFANEHKSECGADAGELLTNGFNSKIPPMRYVGVLGTRVVVPREKVCQKCLDRWKTRLPSMQDIEQMSARV